MDYKYIEQLIEKYFEGTTSLQEEQILHTFFSQDSLPGELAQYMPLFAYADSESETLGDDFDERIMALTEESGAGQPVRVKAKTITMRDRLMPLLRAAAVVAIVLTLGNAMRFSMNQTPQQSDDVNYADYKDTFDDPAVAYDRVEDALMMLSDGYSLAQAADTVATAESPTIMVDSTLTE